MDWYRSEGESWDFIARRFGLAVQQLLKERKAAGKYVDKPWSDNKGKKACSRCGRMVHKKLRKRIQTRIHRGKVCPRCFGELEGEV